MSPMGSRTSPTPADAPYPSLGFSVMKAASAASNSFAREPNTSPVVHPAVEELQGLTLALDKRRGGVNSQAP